MPSRPVKIRAASGAPAVSRARLQPMLRMRWSDPAGPGEEIALAEAAPAERREIEAGGLSVEDHVGEDVADDRRMLEAVAAPPEVGVESRVLRDGPEHRLMVRCHVVDAGVAAHGKAVHHD